MINVLQFRYGDKDISLPSMRLKKYFLGFLNYLPPVLDGLQKGTFSNWRTKGHFHFGLTFMLDPFDK